MSILKKISEKQARGKVKKIYEDIKKTRKIKKIPNFWKTIANDPDTLERTWNSLQQVMKKGSLDPLTKELIYVAVSMTNSCEYCIRSHSLAAKKKGMTDKMFKELIAVVAMANETNRLVESYQVKVDIFLKKYCTALIKRQWGENLKKFEGVQLPGGVTLNGKTIYDEAIDEINKIEEEMNLKWELPPDGFIA